MLAPGLGSLNNVKMTIASRVLNAGSLDRNVEHGKGRSVKSRHRKTNTASSLSEELCSTCFQEDPSNDSIDLVNWMSCDGCYSLHHLVCVARWLCIKCTEQW